jgi:regulator of protease activity HflC (stomatin/prohibitin superfamily)
MTRQIMTSLVLLGLLFTTACGTSIQPGQRGLYWRPLSQGLSPETLKDGFYWQAPWNSVYRYDVRWQSHTEDIDALSADDLQVLIKAAIIIRPNPEELYFLVQEVGPEFYQQIVKPQFMAAVRSVVSGYNMVTVPERSAEIASKVQAVVVENLKGRHLEIHNVALADVDFPPIVLHAIEQKQAKEQEKEQKEFELTIASKDAEIARTRAKGEGDSIRIRAEGEAEGNKIRALGQAKAQETISHTLTQAYLRYKLYDSPNSKLILLPDQLKAPILINPGEPPSDAR